MSNVPRLRFKEFSYDFDNEVLADLLQITSKKFDPTKNQEVKKCIELEHLSQETGCLLGYTDSNEQDSIKNSFEIGQVLFGKLRPYLKKYWQADFGGVCSSEIWVLNGIQLVNSYLYHLVQTSKFNQIANVSSGSKMPRSDWQYMSQVPFNYPSKQEQEKIATFLTSVDTKIEQLSRKEELFKEYKKGVMQKIFAQEIRFKADDGGDFPDWEEKRLGDLTKVIVGGTPSTSNESYWKNGSVPWLSSGGINDGNVTKASKLITQDGLDNSSAKLMPKGTTLLAMTGATLGRVGYLLIETSGNQSVAGLVPNHNFYSKFLFYTLFKNKQTILSMAGGAAQAGVNKATIESFKFKFPIVEEQTKIANFLSSIDSKIEQVGKQLDESKQFKKALLQQMFV